MHHFQDEVAQRNLQVLVEDAIEKETPTVKESITPQKRPASSKKKTTISKKEKSDVPKEDPRSIRKSVRLNVSVTNS